MLYILNSFFPFFTYLAYIGQCAYFCASGTQTFGYAVGWRKLGAGAGYPLQRWPKVLQALHIILRATVVNFGEYIYLFMVSFSFATKLMIEYVFF